ncbi:MULTISPECIES: hypothetical protein [Pseudonocardia]|uniref:Deazaflavin-dependent oxidoreductase, nitroreductase family n=2 Tax=Pseudonocardia TaxID=1847 RepID=A0A1Y2N4A6_PSEAH|nr:MULTISPECIES: hypothetical protein [Pseudonocardia]OSY42310.1 hypothetical protein BG845_01229 [Pseudonocardia autotrophica]TDN75830.1 hypothetical protein C8E95_5014 [Pseudonocardia autotrophica]BBF99801.1 hypothetical protein Pdca_10110 [Pseudonocardia autotrophica]GEC27613.1 hypothetical protein PSA01_46420 [Pseudonocardia saturnea]
MSALQTAARPFNAVIDALLRSPRLRGLVQGRMTILTYTGRRSGQEFSLPVAYQQDGPDRVLIQIALADRKSWWRNFTGDGHPLTVRLDGRDRTGHGVARREGGQVTVGISLDG